MEGTTTSARGGEGSRDGVVPVDDSKHRCGEAVLGCDVEAGARADENLDCLKVTTQRCNHEGRLTVSVEGVNVGTAIDLREKRTSVSLLRALFPFFCHAMPPNV